MSTSDVTTGALGSIFTRIWMICVTIAGDVHFRCDNRGTRHYIYTDMDDMCDHCR